MANRMVNSNLFSDKWSRRLETKWKLLYLYILVKGENSGLWYEDLDTASFQLGCEYTLDEFTEVFKVRTVSLGNDMFFFPDFIIYNHGNKLFATSTALKKVIPELLQYGCIECVGEEKDKHGQGSKIYAISTKVIDQLNLKALRRGYKGASKGVEYENESVYGNDNNTTVVSNSTEITNVDNENGELKFKRSLLKECPELEQMKMNLLRVFLVVVR